MGRFGVKWVGLKIWPNFAKILVWGFSIRGAQTILPEIVNADCLGSIVFQQSTLPSLPQTTQFTPVDPNVLKLCCADTSTDMHIVKSNLDTIYL